MEIIRVKKLNAGVKPFRSIRTFWVLKKVYIVIFACGLLRKFAGLIDERSQTDP
jgi:hypothetical protein